MSMTKNTKSKRSIKPKSGSKSKRLRKPVRNASKRKKSRSLVSVTAPAATGKIVRSVSARSFTIIHRECLGTVGMHLSGGTESVEYSVNAGSPVFPWLSTVAVAFERYRFSKLSFEYVPTCSSNTTGEVVLSPCYDVMTQLVGVPKSFLESRDGAARGNVWAPLRVSIPMKKLYSFLDSHYVLRRNGFYDDKRLVDCMKILAYCESVGSDPQTFGELWCAYSVTLSIPSPGYNPVDYFSRIITYDDTYYLGLSASTQIVTANDDSWCWVSMLTPASNGVLGIYLYTTGYFMIDFNYGTQAGTMTAQAPVVPMDFLTSSINWTGYSVSGAILNAVSNTNYTYVQNQTALVYISLLPSSAQVVVKLKVFASTYSGLSHWRGGLRVTPLSTATGDILMSDMALIAGVHPMSSTEIDPDCPVKHVDPIINEHSLVVSDTNPDPRVIVYRKP